jgi:hypothetical protein
MQKQERKLYYFHCKEKPGIHENRKLEATVNHKDAEVSTLSTPRSPACHLISV